MGEMADYYIDRVIHGMPRFTKRQKKPLLAKPTCPYCGNKATMKTGVDIYPHRCDLRHLRFWACTPCAAWVGCHATGVPLGSLANASLRACRASAHAAFDPLWKTGVIPGRSAAYAWLADQLGVAIQHCHIAMFDEAQCKQVVEVANRMTGHDPLAGFGDCE